MVGDSRPNMFLPAILACVCVQLSSQANCPPGWTGWRDSCYILLKEKLGWHEASRVCGRPGGSLAVPNSLEENNFIYQMQEEGCLGNWCGLWIGCTSNATRELTCNDRKQAPSFKHWVDKVSLGSDDQVSCVFMSKINRGRWLNDYNACVHKRFVLCEIIRRARVYALTMSTNGRVESPCLHGHEFKSLPVKGVVECGAECWAEPRCRSVNLWQGGPTKICQLNSATILESEEKKVSSDNECIYFGL